MAVPNSVLRFLQKSNVKYNEIDHRIVYTAADKAATLKVKPNIIGKTLVLKVDNNFTLVLIPGNRNLDKNKFKKAANEWRKKIGQKSAKKIDFVSERLIKNKFKGVKLGALPPFGNLWGIPTFIDKSLFLNKQIFINSGNYQSSLKINPNILKKLIPDLIVGQLSRSK
jgi:Ala-tRNA(Pro) deacylase